MKFSTTKQKLPVYTLILIVLAAFVFTGCGGPKPRPRTEMTKSGTIGNTSGYQGGLVDGTDVYSGAANTNPDLVQRGGAGSAGFNNVPGGAGGTGISGQYQNKLASIYFDFDRSAVKPSERSKLLDAQSFLSQNPGKRLQLTGHADWRGTTEYNLGLGERRARAVQDYLTNLGVSASKLEVISKGDLEATENGTSSQMSEDRRVDIIPM